MPKARLIRAGESPRHQCNEDFPSFGNVGEIRQCSCGIYRVWAEWDDIYGWYRSNEEGRMLFNRKVPGTGFWHGCRAQFEWM